MKEKKKRAGLKAAAGALQGQHVQFLEESSFLRSALPYIYKADEAAGNVKKTLGFIKKKLIHLDEEEKLFRVLLAGDDLKIKRTIRELQHEHIRLMSIYDEIKDIVINNGFDLSNKKIKEKFVGLVEEMIEFFLEHARKEDERLFPLLAGRNVKINLSF